ncbi:MAG: MBL fold metallo-hydrolase [Erysipelotrichaceae bacterium]|nr:MBL fold metallo-hydrolase [Erysipelotrichaceae bacterium]
MPGKLVNGTAINSIPRPINVELKSKKRIHEAEHPVRWSFMKILREFSTLREYYPEINPYTEAYKVRDNTWALYNDSFDGVGDVWMYLIDGPEKAMIIDTSFGIGDLKGLIHHLVGEKEIIVFNTHAHFDHCYGNAQFGKAYCHENEVPDMLTKVNPHIWDYLFNQTSEPVKVAEQWVDPGQPLYTEFDPADLIEYQDWEVVGVPDGHLFDLGNGYLVEAVLLPGHSAGQCGILDRQTGCLFIGDCTGIGTKPKGTPYREYCCVEAMYNALVKLQPRLKDISGVFPGHGAFDQHPILMQYLLETCEAVLKDPYNYDKVREMVRPSGVMKVATKNIHQWTALRYNPALVTMQQIKEDNEK